MQVKIIENKRTEYVIVVPEKATLVEYTAAEEVKQYIRKAYGTELSIVSEQEKINRALYVGHTEYAKACRIIGTSCENWMIKVCDGNLILTGGIKNDDRGILYAVYHFLEDVVGIRWWSYWEEYVPELSELSLENGFYKEGTPAFPYRKVLSCRRMEHFYYEARNRGNVVGDDGILDGAYHPSIKRCGGARQMGRPHHCHTLPKLIPPEEYFPAHPDWFAWKAALKRHVPHGHYCLTNEELYHAVLEKIQAYIDEDQKLARETGVEIPCFYSITFPDAGGGFCQCDKCKEVLNESGESGYSLRFVNRFARAVADRYPDVKIETLIYSIYLNPPEDDTLPEKNVIIRLAQNYGDILHNIHDKCNRWYLRLLQSWSDICKKAGCELYIWDYMFHKSVDLPLPIAYRLSDNFRTFHQYGVSGIFIENECVTTDMWELNQYMLMHLCEDPYADEETLIDDFMEKFYGPAAVYVKAYLLELKRAATENDYSVFCVVDSANFNYLDVEAFQKGMVLLEKALDAVRGNSVYELRVVYIQGLLGVSLLLKYRDLKHRAESMNKAFLFDKEAVRRMVLWGLEESMKMPRIAYSKKRVECLMEFIRQMPADEEETVQLPEELGETSPSEVYQYFFRNLSRHMGDAGLFGFSVVEDSASATGKVVRMCKAEATAPNKVGGLYMSGRKEEGGQPIVLSIEQDARQISGISLYREDTVPDKYHLYKIGSVAGISESGDTRVRIITESISLTGISVLFPMDACDVYLSMKFTGELYGGSKNDADAIYIDRAIIVRREGK